MVDTHLLIWLGTEPRRVPEAFMRLLENRENELVFSAVSIWEMTIKHALERDDFRASPEALHVELLRDGWSELHLTAAHGVAAGRLPLHHRDPFDRALIAQARMEGLTFLTVDTALAVYGPPVVTP